MTLHATINDECMHELKSKTFDYWIIKKKEWTGIFELRAMVTFSIIVLIISIREKIFINSFDGMKLFKLNNFFFSILQQLLFYPFSVGRAPLATKVPRLICFFFHEANSKFFLYFVWFFFH